MAEQKFKVGDGIKVLDLTGIIVNERKIEDNSIEYLVRVEGNTGGSLYTWVSQNSFEYMVSEVDNFKQTITIETERKTGETVIRISNPRPTTDEPTVRGTIIGDITNKSNKPKITDEQRTVLEGLYLLGYKYIARDKDNALFAYDRSPCRDKGSKGFWNGQYFMIDLNHINSTIHVLDNLCSWEDEKPTSIEWLLGKKDKNE